MKQSQLVLRAVGRRRARRTSWAANVLRLNAWLALAGALAVDVEPAWRAEVAQDSRDRRLAISRRVRFSTSGGTGFTRCSSNPLSMERRLCSSVPCPEIAIIETVFQCGR